MAHLVARWELAIRLELRAQVAGLELLEEALVLCPEQPDVWDAEQHHGQPLQAQPKGPGLLPLIAVGIQDLLLHHPASHALQPFQRDTPPQAQNCV